MDDAALRSLLKRLEVLERTSVRARLGEVTATSPATVTIGGADIEVASVATLAPLQVGDIVIALTYGSGVVIAGVVGGPSVAWTALSPGSGWAATGGIYYAVLNGVVHLRGKLTTLGTTGSTVATLPAGARPVAESSQLVAVDGLATSAAAVIGTGGGIQLYHTSSSTINLDGITFPAA